MYKRQKVVDVSDIALTLEVVGDPGKLVALEKLLEPYGTVSYTHLTLPTNREV